MSKRKRWVKVLKHGLETVMAYTAFGIFRVMPLDMASNCGGAVLRFLGPKFGITRVARFNLGLAFPDMAEAEKQRIILGMWDNLGRVIAEYSHLHRIWHRVEIVNHSDCLEPDRRGLPTIFFGAHMANWEIYAVAAKQAGLRLHLVYRKPNNAGVDGLLRGARESGGAGHIAKGRQGAREILSMLRKGEAVGMLIDQRLSEGIPVPFFGHPAMTTDAMAQFALRMGCQLYPARMERLSGARFRMTVFPALKIQPTDDNADDARLIMTEANAMLEGWVRERPEQWLWIHRRWPQSRQKPGVAQPSDLKQ